MIQIKQLDSTHEGMWDEYVNTSAEATPYHRFAWGQAVKDSYGFDTHYLGAFDDGLTGEATLVGVLPLTLMKTPFKGSQLVAAPYCDAAGPLADSADILSALHSEAIKIAQAHKGASLDLRNASTSMVEPDTLKGVEKVRMLLALENSVDEQMAAFKSKLRSQIRKADKNGLVASVHQYNESDGFVEKIDEFYEVMSMNMHSLGSPVHSKAWFAEVLKAYDNQAFLALVYSDEVVVGGAIVLSNGELASIPWASTKSQYNRLAPNMLLYWTVISQAVERGAKTFDFGRSTAFEGTYNFKKQWGASPSLLTWERYTNGVLENTDASAEGGNGLREKVETVWKKLPLSVVNFIGPKIRKYVSL